jgi:hypothetical protein
MIKDVIIPFSGVQVKPSESGKARQLFGLLRVRSLLSSARLVGTKEPAWAPERCCHKRHCSSAMGFGEAKRVLAVAVADGFTSNATPSLLDIDPQVSVVP